MAYDRKSYETLELERDTLQTLFDSQSAHVAKQAYELERLHARYDKLDNANIRLDRDRANLLDEAVKANAECERLRQAMDWSDAQHDKIKGKLEDANDTLRARVEELVQDHIEGQATLEKTLSMVAGLGFQVDDLKKERDELAKQLALSRLEHAKEADELRKQASEVHETNKELRAQLAESESERLKGMDYMRMQEKRMRAAESELAVANEKLAAQGKYILSLEAENRQQVALQPPAPTLVKQTWQAVGYDSDDVYSEHEIRHHAYYPGCLGLLRRDHYSDGTVKAELEQLGDAEC